MTANIYVRDSIIQDVYAILPDLQDGDKREAQRMGLTPKQAMRYSYRNAIYRKTAFVDGQIAAMWGIKDSPISGTGLMYLATTNIVKTIPFAFTRFYKHGIGQLLEMWPSLEAIVDAQYTQAKRVLELVGFTADPPFELNGHPFQRYHI